MNQAELVITIRRPSAPVEVRRFDLDEVTVGRGLANTITLSAQDVSDTHLRIIRRNGSFLVIDENSTFGTQLGESALGHALVPIETGDVLRIGPYALAMFVDRGGGLTTDTRDSAHLAHLMVSDLSIERAGGYLLAVLTGPQAGALIPLPPDTSIWFGAEAGCAVRLEGSLRPIEVRRGRASQIVATGYAAGARLEGRALDRPRPLAVSDTLQWGEILVELRGPAAATSTKWTHLERVIAAAAALALIAAGLLLLR